jgi:dihydrofolate reductase
MSTVFTSAAVSLDGYIAGPNETGFEHLFAWFDGGDFELPTASPEIKIRLGEADHQYMSDVFGRTGAFVTGRRLFNMSDGWRGRHPLAVPVVVVTHQAPDEWIAGHPDAPFEFVTDGLPAAIARARELAGDRDVNVAAGKISSQCLDLGLLDEITLDLVPVLLGDGVPLFEHLGNAPILLDGPTITVQGERVTHLRYTVRKP